nr:unnamed protein product [Digitaria exilis]
MLGCRSTPEQLTEGAAAAEDRSVRVELPHRLQEAHGTGVDADTPSLLILVTIVALADHLLPIALASLLATNNLIKIRPSIIVVGGYFEVILFALEYMVYDVTKFLEDHPGGDDVLLSSTGKVFLSLHTTNWWLSNVAKDVL